MGASESRFRKFVERLAETVGHADREGPLERIARG
jgi:hypothetical protein